jgi:hypothetical protein
MIKLRVWAGIALTLAILGLIVLFLMFLALVDISRGEEDLVLEWRMVKLGMFVIFFLIISTFICTGLVLNYIRDRESGKRRTGSA